MIRALKLAISLLCIQAAAQSCDNYESVVEQHFPATLKRGAGSIRLSAAWTCAALNTRGSADSIVAAYSDVNHGVVRVLQRSGDTWRVIAEDDTYQPFGMPRIFAQDIDADGRQEIAVVTTYRAGADEYTIYRWNGSALEDITPVPPAREVEPDLGTSEFIDVDGDGRLEFVSHYRCACPTDVFSLRADGSFGDAQTATYLGFFARRKGKPVPAEEEFEAANPQGPYDAIIASSGPKTVASAIVSLNGVVVARPDDFRSGVRSLRVQNVTVLPRNKVSVEVRGNDEATLSVMILPRAQARAK